MPTAPAPKYTAQDNFNARSIVLARAVDCIKNVYSQTLTGTDLKGTVLQIPLNNVGLNKRLLVRVQATVTNPAGDGQTQAITTLGASNFFSQVVLYDLNNQIRIQTAGWHLTAVASAKARMPFGTALTSAANVNPFGYGNNYTAGVQTAGATIGNNTTGSMYLFFEIPMAYADNDLRGAIYANLVNAAWYLNLTINPQFFSTSTATTTKTLSVYQSTSAVLATLTSVTIDVYQNYLDQLPSANGVVILPRFDLQTSYLLLNSTLTGMTINQDFPVPYSNFRDFLSTVLIYDNAGTLAAGTNIAYFSLVTANSTLIFKVDPFTQSLMARQRLRLDMPTGMYYFDHRNKPINTQQFGNMNLNVNISSAITAGAALYVGFEMFALQSQIGIAQSLPGA